MPNIVIVNACSALSNDTVAEIVPLIAAFDKTILAPAYGLDPCSYSFVGRGHPMPVPGPTLWPVYLNLHSSDPGALGWHDDQGRAVFGRCFVGDCLKYHVDWLVDLTHEIWEIRGDPNGQMTVPLAGGILALRELSDPVEDDLFAIPVGGGHKVSDFVLPAYWEPGSAGPWDVGGHLTGPCPTLTSGGYQSLLEDGRWIQKAARRLDGSLSWRSCRNNGRVARRVAKAAR